MKLLVCFLEEPSAKEMLQIIVPRLQPNVDMRFHVFSGKQNMKKEIERKFNGYGTHDSPHFLVMLDQDNDDCEQLKHDLHNKIKSQQPTIVRIACRELESFYLGDLEAVRKAALQINRSMSQENRKYRDPDLMVQKPSKELKEITDKKYYKINGSRAIAHHLRLDGTNKSHSFNVLVDGIKGLLS